MKTYSVTVQGTSPLLMNKPADSTLDDKSKERKAGNKTPEDVAKDKLYEIGGKLYQPSTHFEACLVIAGKNLKVMGKGSSRATYSKILGYSIEINPLAIMHKKTTWEIFSRSAINPSTKGRIMVHRPMLREWELDFEITFDDTEISQEILKQIFDIGGRIVGVGDWRPDKKGKFGKFQIINWEELD